jgi:hypothetical protein
MKNLISSKSLLPVITDNKNNNGAQFTIKSIKTGKDYTYKIKRSIYNDNWFTHVYVEKSYLNFIHLGVYRSGAIYKNGNIVNTPSAIALAYVLNKVEQKRFQELDNKLEIMHTGKCLKCSKILTDAISIELGLGPVCNK